MCFIAGLRFGAASLATRFSRTFRFLRLMLLISLLRRRLSFGLTGSGTWRRHAHLCLNKKQSISLMKTGSLAHKITHFFLGQCIRRFCFNIATFLRNSRRFHGRHDRIFGLTSGALIRIWAANRSFRNNQQT